VSAPATPRVVLYGRAGCHLCDEARAVVARVCGDIGVAWAEVDVDAAPADRGLAGAGAADAGAADAGVGDAGAADAGAADAGVGDAGAADAGAGGAGATGAGATGARATDAATTGTSPAVADLATAYGERVPVVAVDGLEVAQWHVSERALRAALA